MNMTTAQHMLTNAQPGPQQHLAPPSQIPQYIH